MKRIVTILIVAIFAVTVHAILYGDESTSQKSPGKNENAKSIFLENKYPGLSSGCLTFARLISVPEGVILQTKNLTIREADLNQEVEKAPPELREKLRKNAFYLIEQMTAQKLLLQLAQAKAEKAKQNVSLVSESERIETFLQTITNTLKVTDEEVAEFYRKNQDMCGGAKLSQVQGVLKKIVLQEKRQKEVQGYIQTLGQRIPIEVSSRWCEVQAKQMRDNPVDRARVSGRPSLVDFGSAGCRPCDMMAPILETLQEKYIGKLNVLFIHVGQEPILAGRYGIQSIPVQVFFDRKGKEVFRHVGFFPQVEIEKKLQEMGVK
jgi:thiol-disulfide isomerase/thioredoxin